MNVQCIYLMNPHTVLDMYMHVHVHHDYFNVAFLIAFPLSNNYKVQLQSLHFSASSDQYALFLLGAH